MKTLLISLALTMLTGAAFAHPRCHEEWHHHRRVWVCERPVYNPHHHTRYGGGYYVR